jgi:Na+/melibiose symporter-like transporter
MSQTGAAAAADRVPLHNILAFGVIQTPVLAIGVVYGVYLPPNYAGLGVGLAAVAAAITIVRAVDVFFDPLLAMVMDRMRTPIGRYRPWVILGTPIVMVGVWKILIPSGPVNQGYLIVWLLVSFIGLSMMTLGTSAWSAVVATSYHDRARLFAWTSPMGILGIDALLMLPLFTHHKVAPGLTSSMPVIGVIFLVALPVALAICTIFTPERLANAPRRPTFSWADYKGAIARPTMLRLIGADFLLALGPGVTGPLYLFYFHDAKGFSVPDVSLMLIFYVTAGIFGGLFWGGVAAKRLGKHRALQIACVAYSITQSILMAVPRVPTHYTFVDCLPTKV